MKYASALLVLWYSLSIIGFDVHSCMATGEVFIASLVGGIGCEDVHPEHSYKSHGGRCWHHAVPSCCADHHEPSCCDHHQPGSQLDKAGCCSNDLQVLQITGVCLSDDERLEADAHLHQFALDVDLAMELAMPALQRQFLQYLEHPDPGVVMPDRQAFLGIWRI